MWNPEASSALTATQIRDLLATLPAETVTVSGGGDALKNAIAAYHNKLITKPVTFNVAAGVYTPPEINEKICCVGEGEIIINGDTRAIAGLSFWNSQTCKNWPGSAGTTKSGFDVGCSGFTVTTNINIRDTIQIDGYTSSQLDLTTLGAIAGDPAWLFQNATLYKKALDALVDYRIFRITAEGTVLTSTCPASGVLFPPKVIISNDGGTTYAPLKVYPNKGRVTLKGILSSHIWSGGNYGSSPDDTYESDVKIANCVFTSSIYGGDGVGMSGIVNGKLRIMNDVTAFDAFNLCGGEFAASYSSRLWYISLVSQLKTAIASLYAISRNHGTRFPGSAYLEHCIVYGVSSAIKMLQYPNRFPEIYALYSDFITESTTATVIDAQGIEGIMKSCKMACINASVGASGAYAMYNSRMHYILCTFQNLTTGLYGGYNAESVDMSSTFSGVGSNRNPSGATPATGNNGAEMIYG